MNPNHSKNSLNKMVRVQIEGRGIFDPVVLAAMRKIPRENFVSEPFVEAAYEDTPLPIEEGQTISQPYMVALMAESLQLTADSRVLEIGTGSGYAAAILGQIAKEVYTIEYFPRLAELARKRLTNLGIRNVHVLQGDGSFGWSEYAPFQGISVAAAAKEIPPALLKQLSIGGKLVMPVGSTRLSQELIRVTKKDENTYEYEKLGDVRFVSLQGGTGYGRQNSPCPIYLSP